MEDNENVFNNTKKIVKQNVRRHLRIFAKELPFSDTEWLLENVEEYIKKNGL